MITEDLILERLITAWRQTDYLFLADRTSYPAAWVWGPQATGLERVAGDKRVAMAVDHVYRELTTREDGEMYFELPEECSLHDAALIIDRRLRVERLELLPEGENATHEDEIEGLEDLHASCPEDDAEAEAEA